MRQLLKKIIKKTPLYYPIRNWAFVRNQEKELIEWERNGKPGSPPHLFKQRTLKSFSKRFGLDILVETGTYFGDMVAAMKQDFDRIYSIELSKELYEKAKKRFRNQEKIELIHGDSGIELGNLMDRIDRPALFWPPRQAEL